MSDVEHYRKLAAECDERARLFESGELVAEIRDQDASALMAEQERDAANLWRRTAEFFENMVRQ